MSQSAWGVGSKANAKPFAKSYTGQPGKSDRELDLIWGEHPHSTSDNKAYGRFVDTGEILGFDGHRIQVAISLETYNYAKRSHHSGDEIRKGGWIHFKLGMTRAPELVYVEGFRDPVRALYTAAGMLEKLIDHPLNLADEKAREKIVGRKVWWCGQPGTVSHWFPDQGAVCINPEPGRLFKPSEQDLAEGEDYEWSHGAKDSIFSSHIYWFRN